MHPHLQHGRGFAPNRTDQKTYSLQGVTSLSSLLFSYLRHGCYDPKQTGMTAYPSAPYLELTMAGVAFMVWLKGGVASGRRDQWSGS
ncbi:hypothetical protein TNCV_1646931 [Trichonephila clavipes]|nr:hypothetical protein TNCV_1646931 [Trichonephila clavipes]